MVAFLIPKIKPLPYRHRQGLGLVRLGLGGLRKNLSSKPSTTRILLAVAVKLLITNIPSNQTNPLLFS